MHLETQTKKLARTVFAISAGSLAVILLVAGLNAPQDVTAKQTTNLAVYTYQNPFSQPGTISSTAFPETSAGASSSKLVSVRWIAGLSSLATLWLSASCYLYAGQRKRRGIQRRTESATKYPVKMNPLATVPAKPVISVGKEDTVRITILTRPTTRGRFVHRQITAPCQSRFRPISLVSSQTRFGRLK